MAGRNIFNSIKLTKPKRNQFDLTHDVKLSLDMGQLIPTCCLEAIPGDSFNVGCQSLIRFAPMIAPVMHRMDVYYHWFFCPTRLLWPNWEKFITNTLVGGLLPAVPFIEYNSGSGDWGLLADYLGIPDPVGSVGAATEKVLAFPFSAYQFICNEYYRDQNQSAPFAYELNDGTNQLQIGTLNLLRLRAWEHDYLTSALPNPQKGPAVNFPISLQDVQISHTTSDPLAVGGDDTWNTVTGPPQPGQLYTRAEESSTLGGPDGKLFLKGDDVVGNTTISDFRRAEALQKFFEAAARGGSRLREWIWHMFGVNTGDARLQRPEYITGSKSPVVISEVLNTTGTDDAPQGNMAGHGVSVTSAYKKGYFVREHGYLMCIMSVMPKTAYQQGLDKMWLKYDNPYQYFFKQFEHIGEQEVLRREVMAYTDNGGDVFGYNPRYSEYKYAANRVAGAFRNSLDFWHMGRIFTGEPALNEAFMECDATKRIFAVTDPGVQSLYAHVLNTIKARRPMAKYGNPGL